MRVGLRLKWSDSMRGLIFGLREPILDLRGRTLGLRKLSFGPERVNLEPEWGLGGVTYVQTNGRTSENSPLCPTAYRTFTLWGVPTKLFTQSTA